MKTTRGPKLNFKSSRNFSFEFAAEILAQYFGTWNTSFATSPIRNA